jgi:hypothetical protein
MKRWPFIPLAVALTAAVVVAFCPHRPESAESPLLAEPEVVLEGFPEAVILRDLAKKRIAREVADGRRSLVEAAALFGALNRHPPQVPPLDLLDTLPWALSVPAHTEDERLCRQVVQWVEGLRLSGLPDSAEAAVARLNAEYQQELRRHGAIRLPDPSTLPPAQELLDQTRAALTEAERQALFGPCQEVPGGR